MDGPEGTRAGGWMGPVVLALLVYALPAVVVAVLAARSFTITPDEARARIVGSQAVLVDVRTPEEFRAAHVERSVSWPLDELSKARSRDEVEKRLGRRPILTLCAVGFRSGTAAIRLRELGLDVHSVRGGIQEWTASAATTASAPCAAAAGAVRTLTGGSDSRVTPLLAQVLEAISGLVVKPFYMLLSLVIAGLLWKRGEADLVALRRGLVAFFAGELACAVNYVCYDAQSYLVEYLHSVGMVVAVSCMAWAVFEGFDTRILKLSGSGRCAALGLCRACVKHEDVACGLRRVWVWVTPALAIVALWPLCVEPLTVAYQTTILGSPVPQSHAFILQLFEIRYCPLVAIAFLLAAFAALTGPSVRGDDTAVTRAKLLFAIGFGPLCFSFLRLALLRSFVEELSWFNVWEEITELLLILGILVVLWIFAGTLLDHLSHRSRPAPDHAAPATTPP